MENLIKFFFLHQWQRKLVAFLTALFIWFFVNQSIISTKTILSVPIKVINLPNDKTIVGLLPNGFLYKRIALTLTGTKDVIEQLEPGDLEVVVDVSNQENEGVLTITKKNLVSLNPNINLSKHITAIDHPQFIIKMSPVLIEEIMIRMNQPIGEPPIGYEFLDIWPVHLIQKVSGPEEQVMNLKHQGLELTFNLNDILKEQLDVILPGGNYDDIVSFTVPDHWKKVTLPLPNRPSEMINDPEGKFLQISFLRKQLLPVPTQLPIHVFYPLKNSETINPQSYAIVPNTFVKIKNDIPILDVPLFANNVSKLFLDIVKDSIELEIVTAPKKEREKLEWSINFVDKDHLEDTFVAFLLSNKGVVARGMNIKTQERETYFRQRFRGYMQSFALYLSPQHKLEIDSTLEDHQIRVHVLNASQILNESNEHAD